MFNLVVLLRKFATIWIKSCFSLSSVTFSMQAFIKAMPRSAESLVTGKWSANSFIFLYSSNFAQCWEGINSHSGFPLTSNKSKINQDPSATNVSKLGLWPGQDIVGKSLLPFKSSQHGVLYMATATLSFSWKTIYLIIYLIDSWNEKEHLLNESTTSASTRGSNNDRTTSSCVRYQRWFLTCFVNFHLL